MTNEGMDAGVRAAIDAEMALLNPAIRRSAEQAEALLHPDFVEFGRSGRRWDRRSMLAAMTGPLSLEGEAIEVSEVDGVRLADGVVHLTYVTTRGGSVSRRSSLWRRTDGTWRLFFHQGTPAEDESTRKRVLDHLAAFNAHDTDALVAGLHPDVVWATGTAALRGIAQVRTLFDDGLWALRPSLQAESLVVDGDSAAARLTERLRVDGRQHEFAIAAFFEMADGRIRSVKVYREGTADIPG